MTALRCNDGVLPSDTSTGGERSISNPHLSNFAGCFDARERPQQDEHGRHQRARAHENDVFYLRSVSARQRSLVEFRSMLACIAQLPYN